MSLQHLMAPESTKVLRKKKKKKGKKEKMAACQVDIGANQKRPVMAMLEQTEQ